MDEAGRLLDQARDAFAEAEDEHGLCLVDFARSRMLLAAGDLARAEDLFYSAQQTARDCGDIGLCADEYLEMGKAEAALGRQKLALDMWRDGIDLTRRAGFYPLCVALSQAFIYLSAQSGLAAGEAARLQAKLPKLIHLAGADRSDPSLAC